MKAVLIARAINWVINRRLKREPDFIIGGPVRPYMLRWFIIPRNALFNIYHHFIKRSDDDRALHDHPWWSLSIVLDGGMLEILPGGVSRQLRPGDIVLRRASSAHRLEIRDGYFCKTLFITGPRIREAGANG